VLLAIYFENPFGRPAAAGNLQKASAAAGAAAIAVAPAAEAAIVHSGQQDLMVSSSATSIDIDGDGDMDAEFSHSSSYASVEPRNGASFIITNSSSYFARDLSANYNISDSLSTGYWAAQSGYLVISGSGGFEGGGNEYIGVRFTNNGTGQIHYGWIQVNVAAGGTSVKIVDWAWEDTPNTPIPRGRYRSA